MVIAMTEELEVTIMSKKGQVVIPKSIREELEIKPKTKLLVYGKGDIIIMKKLQRPDLKKEWEDIFKLRDKKELKLSNAEIQKEIEETRK